MPTNQSEVRTRKATDDERKPGASIKVGDATEPMPPKDEGSGASQSKPDANKDGDKGKPESTTKTKDSTAKPAAKPAAAKTDGDAKDKGDSKPKSAAEKLADADLEIRKETKSGSKSAAYDKAGANDKTGAKSKTTTPKPPSAKEERYKRHPWLKDAVAAARKLSGHKTDSKGVALGDKTVEYAGPVQHEKVRAIVTAMLKKDKKPVTAETVLGATGIKSAAKLKSIAVFEADKSEMAPLSENLGKYMKNPGKDQKASEIKDWQTATGNADGWAVGRYLAAILYVWVEELRKEAAAAKRENKKSGAKANGNGAKAKDKTPAAA